MVYPKAVTELTLFTLLLVANGSPLVLGVLRGNHLQRPVDGGLRLPDGQPLFGSSKSLPGVAIAVAATSLCALLIGPSLWIGFLIGAFAMLGDLLSSFIKRRLGLASGASAVGLDQIPESMLPLLACKPLLALSWSQVLYLTLAFLAVNLLISESMHRLGIGTPRKF